MDNKKLLKFLFKDIAEIEELVSEKGADGFDEFEIEFIQSRFKGAKQIIQILSEKENKQLKDIRPRPVVPEMEEESIPSQSRSEVVEQVEEESVVEEEIVAIAPTDEKTVEREEEVERKQSEVFDEIEEAEEEEIVTSETVAEIPLEEEIEEKEDVELEEEEAEPDTANHRLGDSFSKEKSVNDLLVGDSNKLEYKISNSPVNSIKDSIGINDRYQYIRELFEGNSDKFTKAVDELDDMNTIQEAVAYLQQNYKWKKNETSLKFVNLVKRRFPNG